jgi:cytochrome b561
MISRIGNPLMMITEKAAPRDGWRKWLPKGANMLLWLLFCAMSGTGLLLAYRLPPGSRGGHGLSVFGWARHEWGDLHYWISFAFLALIFIHMALHWRWFWQIAAKRRAWPLFAGMGAGLALIIALCCMPVKHEESAKKAESSREDGRGSGRQFRGGSE